MSESKRNPTTEQGDCPAYDAVNATGGDVWLSDAELTPTQARRFWPDVFAADRLNTRNRARIALAAHVAPVRRAPRQRRTRRVRAAAAAKAASGDPGGDGDPGDLSVDEKRFIDFLVTQAVKSCFPL